MLDEAARDMLNLFNGKRRSQDALARKRADCFAKFLSCAQECIADCNHLNDWTGMIANEGWGGAPCWKCHTKGSTVPRWGQGWTKCRKTLAHLDPPSAKVLMMIQDAIEDNMAGDEDVVKFSLQKDTGLSTRLGEFISEADFDEVGVVFLKLCNHVHGA